MFLIVTLRNISQTIVHCISLFSAGGLEQVLKQHKTMLRSLSDMTSGLTKAIELLTHYDLITCLFHILLL